MVGEGVGTMYWYWYEFLSSFFSVFYVSLSSMITDEGSLNVCAGADRSCSGGELVVVEEGELVER